MSNSRTALTFLAMLIPLEARSQIALNEPGCTEQNGDVNADGVIDVSDVITILGYLYLGNPHQLTPVCPNARVNLLATGQTFEGWPDCPHMDGFYALGCPAEGRFVDNNDDTITDLCTGLMWQKYVIDVNRDGRWGDADSVPVSYTHLTLPTNREV